MTAELRIYSKIKYVSITLACCCTKIDLDSLDAKKYKTKLKFEQTHDVEIMSTFCRPLKASVCVLICFRIIWINCQDICILYLYYERHTHNKPIIFIIPLKTPPPNPQTFFEDFCFKRFNSFVFSKPVLVYFLTDVRVMALTLLSLFSWSENSQINVNK